VSGVDAGKGAGRGGGVTTMSFFEYRKPADRQPSRDVLSTLRSTMKALEAEAEMTPQMAELKRILAGRISELERKGA
jgi:hypothetical protein